MEVETEIFQPLEIHYSDLLLLSSPNPLCSISPSPSPSDLQRLKSLSGSVMEALGPQGPGLLCVSGIPRASSLRRTLLPLARRLALLRNHDRTRLLKIHGLGTDVSLKNHDRMVSSFALQLKYPTDSLSGLNSNSPACDSEDIQEVKENDGVDQHEYKWDDEFKMLACTFRQLGLCMMDLGLRVARICDREIGGQELEQSILESRSAKGRLIHYHSTHDNVILKEIVKKVKVSKKKAAPFDQPLPAYGKLGDGVTTRSDNKVGDDKTFPIPCNNIEMTSKSAPAKASLSNLWQQWHYDYGIFTVLTSPMFLLSREMLPEASADGSGMLDYQECCPPGCHTYLQLFVPAKNKIFLVKSSPESFLVQIGEAADILSRGKLCSTLHSVSRPDIFGNISRETFVVFLQPTWDKRLCMPEYFSASRSCQENSLDEMGRTDVCHGANEEALKPHNSACLKQEILKSVPPLSSRLRDGMTFAEFSRETTKQYYGGGGIQSQK